MKVFTFTSQSMVVQSLAGLQAINVNVKKLMNPYRGLSTHNRPAKSKCVEVNCKGSFILMLYVPTEYKNKVWLPLSIIRQATDENWLDSLCYFVRLKSVFTKPIFYNYSLRNLATHLSCSPTTINHHLAILEKHGLIWFANGHLFLKSGNQLKAIDKRFVPVGVSANKAEQRTFLRFALVKRNLHSQQRAFTGKSEALQFHRMEIKSASQYKRLRKIAKVHPNKQQLESSTFDVLTLSNQKFGSICNRSKSTGIKVQKAFNELGLVKSISRIVKIPLGKMNRRAFFSLGLDATHFLSFKGFVYKRMPNALELIK